jgi:guanylate cyclase
LIAPLFALVVSGPRSAIRWFLGYAVIVMVGTLIDPYVRAPNNLPQVLITVLVINNILVMSGIAFAALHYFMRQRDEAFRLLRIEQAKSENLLLNILPADIAARLKQGEETIADHHESVTILFMDIVNFTPLSASTSPKTMVDLLSAMFSQFDQWVEEYGVQKIETVGDSYMVAAGLSHPHVDHAQAVARLALDIRSYFERGVFLDDQRLNCRIGVNSGPVTAGVIERKKIAYHVWGDTVNTASRMQSHGVPGEIQISQSTRELIKDDFICEPRGLISVKGKGDMHVWLVKGLLTDDQETRNS